MRWPKLRRTSVFLRATVRALTGIEQRLAEQNQLLTRLADHWAPKAPTETAEEPAVATGVSFLDPDEQARALAYRDRLTHETGRPPTDEEILTFLADGETQDLAARLDAREAEILARPRGRR